jgi:hypothetical protein
MAQGKKTGGRTKGVPNRATAAKAAEIAASGQTPLDYMLSVMRDPEAAVDRKDDMAKAAAPYVHPKLANVQHGGDPDHPIKHELADAAFAKLAAALDLAAAGKAGSTS